jgi:hypothetical protein
MRIFLVVLVLLLMVSPVVAQQTQATDDETITVKKSSLSPGELSKLETQEKIESYGKWVGMGNEVGKAVNSSLGALTTNADKFAKTGVGKFTMFMVAWKVLGADLIQLLIGLLLFVVGLPILLWIYKTSVCGHSVLDKILADGTKVYKYWEPDRDSYRLIGFSVATFIWGLATLITIFA